ncbi:uncharacterized protein BP01DRAFT_102547 [Aspergillus saccharolyticus JOP 1030-1]|uniref:Uncharacterized protein n=1 Tax=Aspergillus saccharolyticus JOP 1030-1 TaxID=1450539 RepID=A0A318Z7S3_9EURO|nr:hypothetical protein BP01DRAFT_102547 [Aspergillus saccharolyticus JOP 1030-1]PYH43355.1 hypothetical protein BP01DRAFT_102547 [Aspergillus saccharolyticus JOP 1030-1]
MIIQYSLVSSEDQTLSQSDHISLFSSMTHAGLVLRLSTHRARQITHSGSPFIPHSYKQRGRATYGMSVAPLHKKFLHKVSRYIFLGKSSGSSSHVQSKHRIPKMKMKAANQKHPKHQSNNNTRGNHETSREGKITDSPSGMDPTGATNIIHHKNNKHNG